MGAVLIRCSDNFSSVPKNRSRSPHPRCRIRQRQQRPVRRNSRMTYRASSQTTRARRSASISAACIPRRPTRTSSVCCPSSGGGSYKEQITFVKDRPGHDRRYAIDARKIERELGWKPAETFETGIRKTVQWYLANGDWVQRVQSGAYREWIAAQYAETA